MMNRVLSAFAFLLVLCPIITGCVRAGTRGATVLAVLVIIGILFVLAILCASIMIIRREHSHHVYILWYLFFLAAFGYSALLLYLYGTFGLDRTGNYALSEKLFAFFIDLATNVQGEFYLVIGILIIGIAPQIMSFIVSGIFGCGSPPILVSTITKIAVFSLIKFFCILSGILTGLAIVQHYVPVELEHGRLQEITNEEMATFIKYEALLTLSVSFLMSAIYYKADSLYRYVTAGSRFRYLNSVLMYMTRYYTRTHSL